MARPPKEGTLGRYGGKDVIAAGVKLTGAGTGLSEALAADPVAPDIGTPVFIVLEGVIAEHTHKPIKDTNALTLILNIKSTTATFVDGDLVADHIEKQRVRNEEAKGVHRLPDPGPDEPDEGE